MPGMKIARILLLALIALALSIAVLAAQVAFRIERTVLLYSYTSAQLEAITSPLYDESIHRETVDGTFSLIRRELSLVIPMELRSLILDSAVEGFSPEWFSRTAHRMLFNIHLVVNGREKELSLPLSINTFKTSFLNAARSVYRGREYAEIEHELVKVPSTLDLAAELPDEILERIVVNLGRIRLIVILLQYAAPALFILLCFSFRKIGSGFTALGIAFIGGGAAVLICVSTRGTVISETAVNYLRKILPSFLQWVDYAAKDVVLELLKGMQPVAVVVLLCGMLFAALGLYLIFARNDPEIRLPGGGHQATTQ